MGHDPIASLFGGMILHIGWVQYLVGLAIVSGVIAVQIFSARATHSLLQKINAGAYTVTLEKGKNAGRTYFIRKGRRVYKPDISDVEAFRAWHRELQGNRDRVNGYSAWDSPTKKSDAFYAKKAREWHESDRRRSRRVDHGEYGDYD